MDAGRTLFVPMGGSAENMAADQRVHCLELVNGPAARTRHVVGLEDLVIGRVAPAAIVVPDSEVSRNHCSVALRDDKLIITDLNSTNGTYLGDLRLSQPTALPAGGMFRVGRQYFRHEWRTQSEIAETEELDRELDRANNYIQALLPPPVEEGDIRVDWFFQPCARLGGDAFGYGDISEDHFAAYLIDVSGHGAGAAMHSVTVMNMLRQRTLPDTDMTDPGQVLAALNNIFQMESHAGLYFTMWYGVYNRRTRQIVYASAGHHASYLAAPGLGGLHPLYARNGLIGAIPGKIYKAEAMELPPGANLYLFSDGVFEIVTKDGSEWALNDFLPLIEALPLQGATRSRQLFEQVEAAARPGGLDDDFSLVVLSFD